jgi:hypothetical protein
MVKVSTFSTVFIFCLTLLLVGCSASKEQKITNAIDEALYYLSKPSPECQKAIDALEEVGNQKNNPRYIQALASAYACRGNFSELNLFDNIDAISGDFSDILASLATLDMAAQTEAESDEFLDVQRAIDVILYSGGKSVPSALETKEIFGTRHGTNLNMQALYMVLVQLGRFSYWYGSTDSTGKKGLSTGVQVPACFFDYEAAPLVIATAHGGGNACSAGNLGSADLDYTTVTNTVAQRRLCQGAMLMNNLIDLLEHITFPDSDSIGELGELYSTVQPYITALYTLDPDMEEFVENLDQATCEDLVAADDDVIQLYFASLFEGGLP